MELTEFMIEKKTTVVLRILFQIISSPKKNPKVKQIVEKGGGGDWNNRFKPTLFFFSTLE